jgi:hypothetical protein
VTVPWRYEPDMDRAGAKGLRENVDRLDDRIRRAVRQQRRGGLRAAIQRWTGRAPTDADRMAAARVLYGDGWRL